MALSEGLLQSSSNEAEMHQSPLGSTDSEQQWSWRGGGRGQGQVVDPELLMHELRQLAALVEQLHQ